MWQEHQCHIEEKKLLINIRVSIIGAYGYGLHTIISGTRNIDKRRKLYENDRSQVNSPGICHVDMDTMMKKG